MYLNELFFGAYAVGVGMWALLALCCGKEFLITLMSLEWVLANLFVTKQIPLVGLEATASDALAIGAALCLNLVQEYYGRSEARKAIWIGFGSILFFIFSSIMHLLLVPSSFDIHQVHFVALLSPMPRLMLASLVTYLITQFIESRLYSFLNQKLNNKYFIIRNYSS
ncbi:MAG TPA: queuosine precursor transporter, partial [Candidatus Babeliaceae bacterium]|nr:queuosine precursor transporter [Candidatus Babeliaceae bacterium]